MPSLLKKHKYLIKKLQNGGAIGDPIPPAGTISGDLLRALESVKKGDTESSLLSSPSQFQDFVRKYDATQTGRVDSARNYYNAMYSSPKVREILAERMRQTAREKPDKYGLLGEGLAELTKERGDSVITPVLKALEQYGKKTPQLIEELKKDMLNEYIRTYNYEDDHRDKRLEEFATFNKSPLPPAGTLKMENIKWDEEKLKNSWIPDDRFNFQLNEDQLNYAQKLIEAKYPKFTYGTEENKPYEHLYSKRDKKSGQMPDVLRNEMNDILMSMTPRDLANLTLDFRKNITQDIPYELTTQRFLNEDESGFGTTLGAYTRGGESVKSWNENPYITGAGIWPSNAITDTALEELSHAMDFGLEAKKARNKVLWEHGLNLTPTEADVVGRIVRDSWDRFEKETGKPLPWKNSFALPNYKSRAEYRRDPSETVARIRVLKNLSGEALPEGGYTQAHLDKIKSIDDTQDPRIARSLEELREPYTDEEILEMMNTIFSKGGKIPYKVKKRHKMKLTKK
jgi:hypothetical protein